MIDEELKEALLDNEDGDGDEDEELAEGAGAEDEQSSKEDEESSEDYVWKNNENVKNMLVWERRLRIKHGNENIKSLSFEKENYV